VVDLDLDDAEIERLARRTVLPSDINHRMSQPAGESVRERTADERMSSMTQESADNRNRNLGVVVDASFDAAYDCALPPRIEPERNRAVIKLRFPMKQLLAIEDPREVPAYTVKLASHYLRMPAATLRSWVQGRNYRTSAGVVFASPIIQLPDAAIGLLSFYNLAEAHVLSALRREHEISMHAIKTALDFVKQKFGWERPLIQQRFEVSGAMMLVRQLEDDLVDAAGGGQRVLGYVKEHLQRIEWEDKLAARLYPFTRKHFAHTPRMVLIDPRYSFGQPFLAKTRIPTAVVAERYKAGDSVKHLAGDYGCPQEAIEEAIRCELDIAMAA
jgi:uncharacterized protein (DUF433 family)